MGPGSEPDDESGMERGWFSRRVSRPPREGARSGSAIARSIDEVVANGAGLR